MKNDDDIEQGLSKHDRMRAELQSLHQEMEIAEYAKTHNGQFRRKLPKKQSGVRTKKRKLLEKSDAKYSAVEVSNQPRLRGSRVALEEEVIQGSAIYPENIVEKGRLQGDDDDLEEADEFEESDESDDDSDNDNEPAPKIAPKAVPIVKRRLVYRMRNFKSQRMAQRHGEALGAHARGLPREAIRKLEQVAADAPNAPQVYSSLGMVYEDLMVSQRESNPEMDDEALEEQLRLAKKAYGSYHAAAVLCKKDFTLWVRAGDTAIGIVSTLNEAMLSSNSGDSEGARLLHLRSEKRRWLEDAKRDYTVADNLKPPGIDVPAKLADVHIQLCNLSEALTLLTDLKNREAPKQEGDGVQPRSDFERSYKAWLLYSDLMLRIGHETTQWNRGIRTNENYMFKRWLRKFSVEFDWQERRLQSLTLAFEAAAGSKACTELMEWSRQRAKNYTELTDPKDAGRWHNDLYGEQLDNAMDITEEAPPDGEDVVIEGVDNEDASTKEHKKCDVDNVAIEREDEVMALLYKEEDCNDPPYDQITQDEITEKGSYFNLADDGLIKGVDDDDEDANSDHDTFTENDANISFSVNADDCKSRAPLKKYQQSDFEAKRSSLVAANKAELIDFDRKTRDMHTEGDPGAQEKREAEREMLVKNQRAEILAMVREHLSASAETAGNQSEKTTMKEPLPIAASCSTVCSIASELMKHCIGLEEFEGARLVGNATSSYLRQRVEMHRERLESIIAFTRRQESTDESVLLNLESYDRVTEESADESEAGVEASYLSDEELIDSEFGESILESMQAGILPSELQVLYAMSLIGEGGRDYAASKAILSITALEDSEFIPNIAWAVDTDIIPSKHWQLFRSASTDPLIRISAFAFVADMLKRTNKEFEWSDKLSGLFHNQVERMREFGQLQSALEGASPAESAQMAQRRQQVLKIVLATARLNLHKTTALALAGNLEDAASRSVTLLDQLCVIMKSLWHIAEDGSVPTTCIEILSIASSSISTIKPWLLENLTTRIVDMRNVVEILSKILSIVLSRPLYIPVSSDASVTDATTSEVTTLPEWTEFPIQSEWQTSEERAMSLSAYNFIVSCSVTSFSGFEDEEFNLNLLKRNAGGTSYFGVSMNEGRVSGPISAEIEAKVQQIWTRLGQHIPLVASFDLPCLLEKAKESTWFENPCPREDLIARYGESHALSLLLDYCELCISLESTAESKDERAFRLVLSTTLPLLQFCLATNVWDSSIGKTITSLSSQSKKKASGFTMIDFSSSEMTAAPLSEFELLAKIKVDQSIKMREKWLSELSSRDSLMKIVRIPMSTFLAEWRNNKLSVNLTAPTEDSACDAMRRVESSIQALRQCYTTAAVQKASLQVSVALLDLVATGSAFNPFLCLQHAAIYASLGSKGGIHDSSFRTVLPDEKACTALEALVIAGRADCLQALHFPMESIFLCNFVGRVCLGHRDRLNEELEWNGQWRMVSIYVYNTTMTLRSTVVALLPTKEAQQKAWSGWDEGVLDELERARLDGVALKKTLEEHPTVASDDSSESSEENFIQSDPLSLVMLEPPSMNLDEEVDSNIDELSEGDDDDDDDDSLSDTGEVVAI